MRAFDLLTTEEREAIAADLKRAIFRPREERPDSFFDTSHTDEAGVLTLEDLKQMLKKMGWSPDG